MRLVSINYWAGKGKREVLILLIGVDERGQLIGLRSDKLSNADVKKLKDKMDKLDGMEPDEIKEYLAQLLPSYKKALVEMKKGRYEVMMEHKI